MGAGASGIDTNMSGITVGLSGVTALDAVVLVY